MFKEKQGFGFAIPALLFEIVSDSVAAKMPDDRGRAKADLESLVLQTPAKVHVVTGGAKNRIESVDGLQRLPAKSHVAAWDVFCDLIVEQDMGRRAGRHGDAGRDESVVRRRQIGATYGAERPTIESAQRDE